jgi:hypothetical protein
MFWWHGNQRFRSLISNFLGNIKCEEEEEEESLIVLLFN